MLTSCLGEQYEDETGGEAVRNAECICACRVDFESVTSVLLGESCGYFRNILRSVAFPSLLIKSSFLPPNPASGVAVRLIHIEQKLPLVISRRSVLLSLCSSWETVGMVESRLLQATCTVV